MPPHQVLLMLGGGAARGALQVPIVEQLSDRVTVWAGTSVGAVNAAAGAARKPQVLREVWSTVRGTKSFQSVNDDVWNGLFRLRRLERLMQRHEVLVPIDPLWVGLFDYALADHRLEQVRGSESDVWTLIKASASQPLVHERVQALGRWLGDGGVITPLPTVPPSPARFTEVHAVFCTPDLPLPAVDQDAVSDGVEQAARALDVFVHAASTRARTYIKRWATMHPDTRVFLYQPESWEDAGRSFDARPGTIAARLEHGVRMMATGRELKGPEVA